MRMLCRWLIDLSPDVVAVLVELFYHLLPRHFPPQNSPQRPFNFSAIRLEVCQGEELLVARCTSSNFSCKARAPLQQCLARLHVLRDRCEHIASTLVKPPLLSAEHNPGASSLLFSAWLNPGCHIHPPAASEIYEVRGSPTFHQTWRSNIRTGNLCPWPLSCPSPAASPPYEVAALRDRHLHKMNNRFHNSLHSLRS